MSTPGPDAPPRASEAPPRASSPPRDQIISRVAVRLPTAPPRQPLIPRFGPRRDGGLGARARATAPLAPSPSSPSRARPAPDNPADNSAGADRDIRMTERPDLKRPAPHAPPQRGRTRRRTSPDAAAAGTADPQSAHPSLGARSVPELRATLGLVAAAAKGGARAAPIECEPCCAPALPAGRWLPAGAHPPDDIRSHFLSVPRSEVLRRSAAHAAAIRVVPDDAEAARAADRAFHAERASALGRDICPCREQVPPGGRRCKNSGSSWAAQPGYLLASDGSGTPMPDHLTQRHVDELHSTAESLPRLRACLSRCSLASGTTLDICTRCVRAPAPNAYHPAVQNTPEERRHHHVAALVVFDDDRLFGGCAAHQPDLDGDAAAALADDDEKGAVAAEQQCLAWCDARGSLAGMLSQEHPGLSRVPPNVLTGEHGMGFSRQDGARPLRILASPEELADGLQDVERIVGRVERMSVAKRIPNNSPTLAAWGRVQRRIELTFARARSDRDFITACRMAATRHCVLRKARGSKTRVLPRRIERRATRWLRSWQTEWDAACAELDEDISSHGPSRAQGVVADADEKCFKRVDEYADECELSKAVATLNGCPPADCRTDAVFEQTRSLLPPDPSRAPPHADTRMPGVPVAARRVSDGAVPSADDPTDTRERGFLLPGSTGETLRLENETLKGFIEGDVERPLPSSEQRDAAAARAAAGERLFPPVELDAWDITAADVRTDLHSCKPTTAAGPNRVRPFLSRQAIELPGFEDIAHLRARASNRIFNGDVPAACCAIFAVMDGRQIFKTAACVASKIRPLCLANTRRRELGKHGASILLADLKTRIADQLGLIHDGFCVGVRAWRELRKLALAAAGQNEADAAWLHHAVRFTDAARAVARLSTTVDRDIAAANAAANGGGSQDPGTAQLAAARADELERLERRAERLGRVEADARLARDAARARDNLPVVTPEEATMAALSPPLRAHVIAGRKQREAEMLADPSLAIHDCPLPPAPPELRAECRAHLEGKPCRKLDDMRNAFGLVSRRWVLRLMMAVCPQFVHGFLALYGSETLVFTTRGTALWLSTGFAQGDPLANPCFALPAWFVTRLVRISGCRPVMY